MLLRHGRVEFAAVLLCAMLLLWCGGQDYCVMNQKKNREDEGRAVVACVYQDQKSSVAKGAAWERLGEPGMQQRVR